MKVLNLVYVIQEDNVVAIANVVVVFSSIASVLLIGPLVMVLKVLLLL